MEVSDFPFVGTMESVMRDDTDHQSLSTLPTGLSRPLEQRERQSLKECAGRDLNPHGISTTSPSNSRVCHSTTRAHSRNNNERSPRMRSAAWSRPLRYLCPLGVEGAAG